MNEMPSPIVPRIVWAALLSTQVVLILIPRVGSGEGAPEILVMALGAVAVIEGFAALVMFRVAVVGRIRSGAIDVATPEGAARVNAALIVCWALAESLGIYAFVLRVLGASLVDVSPFVMGGIVLMGITHPWHAGLRPPVPPGERGRDSTPIG